jgi:hypothetical protein
VEYTEAVVVALLLSEVQGHLILAVPAEKEQFVLFGDQVELFQVMPGQLQMK